jgi:hypothetical protein
MPLYVLPSSKKILVKEGKVNSKVLSDLVKEAYKKGDLYAECEIQVKRKEKVNSKIKGYFSYVTYKELWDCYRNLSGREDLHPYDKIHGFSLGKAFAAQLILDKFLAAYVFIGNLAVGEVELDEQEKNKEKVLELIVR